MLVFSDVEDIQRIDRDGDVSMVRLSYDEIINERLRQ